MPFHKPYSAVLFGPQLIDLKAEKLSRIRGALSSSPILRDLYKAVLHFDEFGGRLEGSDPSLTSIGVKKLSSLLSKWVEGSDSEILEALDCHSNAIAGSLTVINQVLLFVQQLKGSSIERHRISILPEAKFEGLCIGQLAATAARLSLGGEELGRLSSIAVRLAFCIGAYVDLDQRMAGDINEASCLAVSCYDGLDSLRQIRDILVEFDTAYVSIVQKSKITITVRAAQAPVLIQKLNARGLQVKPFNLRGRFHCSKMSWAVEKILQLVKCQSDLQFVSHNILEPILTSILTLPQDWRSTLSQLLASSEVDPPPFVLSIGEKLVSAKLAETLGFQIETADVLSTREIGGECNGDYQEIPRQRRSTLSANSWSPPYPDSAIAVIGMACKFAGADSLDQFWKLLETGTVMCQDLPHDRFPDSRFERRSYPKNFKANTISDVDVFDHKFFSVSSREAMFMDPQQRLALQVTYQALESAGYFNRATLKTNQNIGCYLAACTNEYHENVATHPPSAFSLTGSIRPFIAGKVSHFFGWTGPAIMYDTACAASGTAIHQACRAVATGECSEAIAGGVNVFVSPDTFQNLAGGHFISRTGASKSFDAAADGYCRGEGIAIIMLKKLSAAIRDGDLIKGVIASTVVGQDANESSITVPHGPSQMNLYRKALLTAGLDAQDISYVEAHGTGTPVGDPIEAESIRAVFGNSSGQHHGKTYLGSLKSNIGHTEASSGISGLIKVLLMMQNGAIPQQALFNKLNPAIKPLEPFGIEIPTKTVPWTANFKAACVNNYGASGTTAVMIITQPPNVHSPIENHFSLSPKMTYPISIAASSSSSLLAYSAALLDFINQSHHYNNDLTADIAYHLSRRRNFRLTYSVCSTVSSLDELKGLCLSTMSKEHRKTENTQRSVVLLFGGQTGNMVTVPRALYDSSEIFRKHLRDCDTTLQTLGVPSIFPAIFEGGPHNDIVSLHSILFSGQYASAMAWLDCGLKPARLIGHSFGQLTALCVSGVLSLLDTLRFITTRARYIRDYWGKDPGSMIAIETDLIKVSNLLTQHSHLGLEIACYNGPQNFVLAGSSSSVDAFEIVLKSLPERLRWRRLQVTNAFHSALSEPLIKRLQETAEQLDFRSERIDLESCSKTNSWKSITPALVASHIRDPVYFSQAVERISDQLGPCVWVEAGSESGLSILRQALGKSAPSHSLNSLSMSSDFALKSMAEVVTNLWRLRLSVQFWPFNQIQQHQYSMLDLPPYQFDKSRHWLEWKDLTPPAIVSQNGAPWQTQFLKPVRETKDGALYHIDTKCDTWQDLCSEYRILGHAICPLSPLLELISKAIDTIQDAPTLKTGIYCLEHLVIQNPIPARQEDGIALTITRASQPQSWTFMVTNASGSIRTYVSGTVSVSASHEGGRQGFTHFQSLLAIPHIKGLTSDAEADSVKGKAVYNGLAPLFRIPKRREVVKEVSAKGGEAIAYLVLPRGSSFAAIEDFIQAPLIYLNILRDREDSEMYINTSVGSAGFKNSFDFSLDEQTLCAAYIKVIQSQGPDTTCNIFVFSLQSEELFATFLDVNFTRVKTESFRQSLSGTATYPHPTVKSYTDPSEVAKVADTFSGQHRQGASMSCNESVPTWSADLPDLTQALFNLLARVADVDVDDLRNDVAIPDLGIDSLMAMEVAEEINNFFSITIELEEFAAVYDIASLCKLIAGRTTSFAYEEEASGNIQADRIDTAESSAPSLTSATSDTELSSNEGASKMSNQILPQTRSAPEILENVVQTFDAIRKDFDVFARATGCDKFWSSVYPSQASLVAAYIVEAFEKLGCDLRMANANEKIRNIPRPKHKKLVRQLMRALRDEGLVMEVNDDWIRNDKTISIQPSSEQFNQILTSFPQFAPDHKLLHAVGSKLNECLSGKLDPLLLLFGSTEKRKLMADQYTIAPIQSSVSQQLGSFIEKCFGSRDTQQVLRVLEVGGGTCGTTLHAVNAFAKIGIPIEYTFSDISPSFISAAKVKLNEYKFVSFRTLDITQSPGPDLRHHFDMIIATNVIHATPDACDSASNIRQMLRPGGFLTLMEYTRNLYMLDVIFGQLDGWWLHSDGRDHAIMDENGWEKTLKRAGFENVDWTEGQSEESKIFRIILTY